MEVNQCPSCVAKVNALIANTKSPFQESDRKWLEVLEEAALDKLVPQEVAPVVNTEAPKPVTREEAFATLGIKNPKEFMDQAQFGLGIYQQQKAAVIAAIVANTEEGVWTPEELDKMEFETLQKLSKSVVKEAQVVDFSMFGARPVTPVTNQQTVEPMPMTGIVFAAKS